MFFLFLGRHLKTKNIFLNHYIHYSAYNCNESQNLILKFENSWEKSYHLITAHKLIQNIQTKCPMVELEKGLALLSKVSKFEIVFEILGRHFKSEKHFFKPWHKLFGL